MSLNKNIIRIGIVTILILLVPLVAMQFNDDVNWDLFDFVVMGAALFGAGLAFELIAKKSKKTKYRVAFAISLGAAFLLFWVNGAVGIIGSEDNPANLLYIAVFAVGLIGSLIARFKPLGMARTLFVAAVVQMLVPVVALIIWRPDFSPGVLGVFILNAFFAVLFVASALLFRQAGSKRDDMGKELKP